MVFDFRKFGLGLVEVRLGLDLGFDLEDIEVKGCGIEVDLNWLIKIFY